MKRFAALSIVGLCALCGSGYTVAASIPHATQQQIREALSAAPPAVAADASVVASDGKGHATVLRKGSNGWTCMMASGDPEPLPVCYDANGMAWRKAIMAGRAPDPDKPGFSYMLQGGSAWSNTDPNADKLPAGRKDHIHIPPHIMILSARVANASGLPSGQANPDTHEPFVMFGGTPYAIVIIPAR